MKKVPTADDRVMHPGASLVQWHAFIDAALAAGQGSS